LKLVNIVDWLRLRRLVAPLDWERNDYKCNHAPVIAIWM
jgi:hypothetical protein